jgi:hypothetical protein
MRPAFQFFNFVCMEEALYLLNLNLMAGVQQKGELFREIFLLLLEQTSMTLEHSSPPRSISLQLHL